MKWITKIALLNYRAFGEYVPPINIPQSNYEFILRGKTALSLRAGFITTSELVSDPASYLNKLEQKISELDIVVMPGGSMQFIHPETVLINQAVLQNRDVTGIVEFSVQYPMLLAKFLEKREKEEYASLLTK